jgi:hypothetical protein
MEVDNWDVYLCENSHSYSKVKVPTIIEELYMETALDSHCKRQAKFQNTFNLRKIKSRTEHSVPCL